MRSNTKHTTEEIEKHIHLYLEEGTSYKELCEHYGLILSESRFREKVLRYQIHRNQEIQSKLKNNHYSKDFKLTVVNEHIIMRFPIKKSARIYNVPSHETFRNWIMKYTRGEEIRSYSPKPEVYTMKVKKATQAEKMEIVKDCLLNDLSDKYTAENYQVSDNNVYSWIQKYKKHGPDGLIDGSQRGKPEAIQTETERMCAESATLKARNEYLETENAALKKLEEVERQLMLRKRV